MAADLITEWSSTYPDIAAMLRGVAELPEGSPERYECLAGLHTLQAQLCHKRIGQIEMERRESARNRRNAQKRTS